MNSNFSKLSPQSSLCHKVNEKEKLISTYELTFSRAVKDYSIANITSIHGKIVDI